MCSLGFRSITLSVLRWPWVAAAAMAHQTLLRAIPWPFLALHLWKHTCFALLPVQMLDKETDCLILSLAQSWRADFWNFSTCESPFLGFICSVSCPPMRHLDCFFYCFSVPFPLVVYFL